MQNLGVNYHYILEMSLTDLRQKSKAWLSEIELWLLELTIFRKMLRVNQDRLIEDNTSNEKELDHFRELIDYYEIRLLRNLKSKLEIHEGNLIELMDGHLNQDEGSFRENHKNIGQVVHAFENEFRNLKKEFLTFMEAAIKE
jgi:hypothetical protein